MREYRTIDIIKLLVGRVKMSEKQAGKRRHAIKETKEPGIYSIIQPIMFKAGEIIGLESIDKSQEVLLEPVDGKSFEQSEPELTDNAQPERKKPGRKPRAQSGDNK